VWYKPSVHISIPMVGIYSLLSGGVTVAKHTFRKKNLKTCESINIIDNSENDNTKIITESH
jgi:hypothetical protein